MRQAPGPGSGHMRVRPLVGPALLVTFVAFMAAPVSLDLARPNVLALVLAHLSHVSWDQVLYAGLPAALCATGYERAAGARQTLALVVGSMLAVGLAVLVFERGRIESYSGSSGLGHALAAALAVRGLGRRAGLGLAAVLVLKVAYELASGRLVCDVGLERAGAVPVPVAHAAGVAAGLGLAALGQRAAGAFRLA